MATDQSIMPAAVYSVTMASTFCVKMEGMDAITAEAMMQNMAMGIRTG